jgi:tetratricopeptide (TPR) repeat protein
MHTSSDHLARADELRRLGRYDLALQEIQRALALDPHASEPHIVAAWTLRDQKRHADAEQAARAAIAADPTNPDAHHVLAVALWSQARLSDARQAFDAALALVGGNSALYLTNYARMMTSYHTYPDALVALTLVDRALALAPSWADPHEIRGLALRLLGRDAEADQSFRAALRLNPQSYTAQHNFGLHDLTLGRVPSALERFREALRLNPNSTPARANLVLALKARNPIYRAVLKLTLRAQRPADLRWRRRLLATLGGLFVISLLVGVNVPAVSALAGMIWGTLLVAFLLFGLLRLVWLLAVDPIFNMLLLLDPLGRQVTPFDRADAAVTGSVLALALGLLGCALAIPLSGGESHLTDASIFLTGGGFVSAVFGGAIRALHGRGRALAWAGFGAIILAVLAVIAGHLLSLVDLSGAISAPLFGSAALLFTAGLIVFCIGYMIARPRSGARPAQRKLP